VSPPLCACPFAAHYVSCVRRQPGQTSTDEVKRRDLRAELLAAEADARARKRKADGRPVEDEPASAPVAVLEDDEANKRRKLLQEALEMDRDEDSDEASENGEKKKDADEDRCVFIPSPSVSCS
jgi:protein CWC15